MWLTNEIAEATRSDLKIMEVPVVLNTPPEGRTSKLRTVRDGFRHVFYIMKNP